MKKLVFAFMLIFCVGIAPVFACTQPPPPIHTPVHTPDPFQGADYLSENASVIFSGRVTENYTYTEYGAIYEVRVQRYLKGSGYEIIQIEYGLSIGSCGYGIAVGKSYVFFMEEPVNNTGIPRYSYPIFQYPIEAEATVTAITGQSNPAQPLPLDIQMTRIAESGDLNWLYIPLSILAALLGLVILALSLRRTRRKSKAKREELP
jgi:hypothetical protein